MTPSEYIGKAQAALQNAQNELDNSTQTVVDVSVGQWVVTAGSDGCQVRGTPHSNFTLKKGDVYALSHNVNIEENLVALRTALSECIRQRDELRVLNTQQREEILASHTQVVNLQEFNNNQRKQLESLQKEMAAIHMCVVATSQAKLDEVIGIYGREMPFLLKAVYEAMDRYFNTKAAAEQRASVIAAIRKEIQ